MIMTPNILLFLRLRAAPCIDFHHHQNKEKEEKLQVKRQQKMESMISLETGQLSSIRHEQAHQHGRSRRRMTSAAMAILPMAICMVREPSLMNGVHAYSPSIGFSRRSNHYCGNLPSTKRGRRQQPFSPSSGHWSWSKAENNVRSAHLFSAVVDDIIQEGENGSMVGDEILNQDTTTNNEDEATSKIDVDAVFDNILPSTMASATNSRTVQRSRYGYSLSPSGMPPLSESIQPQQNPPPFQLSKDNPSANNPPAEATNWKERLVDVSNLASLLCVLDCTLLPFVSIAIPALSWGVGFIAGSGALGSVEATTSSNSVMAALSTFLAYLPAISHGIALYFVIPVGLLTTNVNYFFGHKEVRFSAISLLGIAIIYMANSSAGIGISSIDAWLLSSGIAAAPGIHAHGSHIHDTCGAVVGAATGMMAHTCPEGLAHRLTNTLGCAFLLGSNYYSKKYMEEKSQGCVANALAEAWGGDSGGEAVCPPGCGCEVPLYGMNTGSNSRMEGETFFQWEGGKEGER